MSFFKKIITRKSNGRIYWGRHHKRWEKSGITQAEYCHREKIALSSFTNWRNRIAQENQEQTEFIEVQPAIRSETLRGCLIELEIPAIGVMRIPVTIPPDTLHMILSAVKGIA